MNAAALAPVPARALAGGRGRAWLASTALLAALAAIVGARWWATRAGLDPLGVGLAFGLSLCAVGVAARRSPGLRPRTWAGPVDGPRLGIAIAIGTVAGLALVALTVAGGLANGPLVAGLGRPASPFLPWALVTIVVASGQEVLLRGILFDRVRLARGTVAAIALTTAAFALLHVPLYGWHVVPLDLAVGLLLAGLRLGTGTVAAPVAAHAVADLATWWL